MALTAQGWPSCIVIQSLWYNSMYFINSQIQSGISLGWGRFHLPQCQQSLLTVMDKSLSNVCNLNRKSEQQIPILNQYSQHRQPIRPIFIQSRQLSTLNELAKSALSVLLPSTVAAFRAAPAQTPQCVEVSAECQAVESHASNRISRIYESNPNLLVIAFRICPSLSTDCLGCC